MDTPEQESSQAQTESESPPSSKKHDLSFIIDVPLTIIAELGRVELTVKELLSLKKGSVIELWKLAGEPLEMILEEELICKGEVIVMNDHYGVRMTDIIKPDSVQEAES
jgi:flagellar motor switch protein FliN/FliY